MNKFFVGLLVIIAGGLAGWYYVSGKPSPEIPTTTGTETIPTSEPSTPSSEAGVMKESGSTVVYTDSGFTPKTLTVKAGSTVSFENKSAVSMWVASDLHPTHKLLVGFDALKGSASGSVYTYTFTKVGTWTYHDHLHAQNTGLVIVTE